MKEKNIIVAEDGTRVRRLTIKEWAAELGEEYVVMSNVVNFLVSRGIIKEVGKKSAEGGRGKPSSIYEISEVIELILWEDVPEPTVVTNENSETVIMPDEPETITIHSPETVST